MAKNRTFGRFQAAVSQAHFKSRPLFFGGFLASVTPGLGLVTLVTETGDAAHSLVVDAKALLEELSGLFESGDVVAPFPLFLEGGQSLLGDLLLSILP